MTTPATALNSVPSTRPISINPDPTKTAKASRSRQSARILAGSIAACGVLMLLPMGQAATSRWDVAAGDGAVLTDGTGTWSVGAPNWNDAGVDQNWADNKTAVFGGGTSGTAGAVTVTSAVAPTSLTFNQPFAGNYTLSGGTIDITGGGGITDNGTAGNTIVNSALTGTASLNKMAGGTLTVSGINAYTGPTTVNAGTLNIQSNTALGTAAGGTTVAMGGRLQLQNNITVTGEALTLNGGDLVVATGGTATTSGAYEIRTFTSSGTLTVSAGGSLEYLAVGGGGGGGGQNGGGGGGGQLRTGSLSVAPDEIFIVTRGAGGGVNGNDRGSNGGTSSLISGSNSVSAFGGGGGGAIQNDGRGNGGSGTGSAGGNGWKEFPAFPSGVAGGNGGSGGAIGGNDRGGGGGGGAGGNGTNGVSGNVGGNGGIGNLSAISGTPTYYAGGGGGATANNTILAGGGQGGLGGGGKGGFGWGSSTLYATAGAANTGGGGGGADDGPGIGGSGIVIVRYISSSALENVSGNNAWTGAITLGTDIAIASLAGELTLSGAIIGGFGITKVGAGILTFGPAGGGGSLAGVGDLTAQDGTTNVNSVLGGGTSDVSVTGATTKLRFGTVSQTLGSLTIGAGSTVVFTSGAASGSFSGDEKGAGFAGAAAVPEPGTLGLLLLGALGAMNRRRR